MQETQETQVCFLGCADPLEEEMATHSSILAWKIPRTEEPGGLQSIGLQRVRHDWAAEHKSVLKELDTTDQLHFVFFLSFRAKVGLAWISPLSPSHWRGVCWCPSSWPWPCPHRATPQGSRGESAALRPSWLSPVPPQTCSCPLIPSSRYTRLCFAGVCAFPPALSPLLPIRSPDYEGPGRGSTPSYFTGHPHASVEVGWADTALSFLAPLYLWIRVYSADIIPLSLCTYHSTHSRLNFFKVRTIPQRSPVFIKQWALLNWIIPKL